MGEQRRRRPAGKNRSWSATWEDKHGGGDGRGGSRVTRKQAIALKIPQTERGGAQIAVLVARLFAV